MERSIVGLTAAMVHYFRRPPHCISPREEAGRGDGMPQFSTNAPPKHPLVGDREGTTVRAPSPRLFAGRGEVRGVAISRPGSCDARFFAERPPRARGALRQPRSASAATTAPAPTSGVSKLSCKLFQI